VLPPVVLREAFLARGRTGERRHVRVMRVMQQVDAETPRADHRVVARSRPVDADGHGAGIEAHRHDRGHGEADGCVRCGIEAGDDAHRRGHVPQHALEPAVYGRGHVGCHRLPA
jgi:hypothetical protein